MRRYRFTTRYTDPKEAGDWQHALYLHVVRVPALCHAGTRTRTQHDLGDLFTVAEAEGRIDPQVSRRQIWEAWRKFAEGVDYGWLLEIWDADDLYFQYNLCRDPYQNVSYYVRAEAHALGNLLKSHVGTNQERHDLIHRTLDYGLGWRGDK